MKTTDIQFQYPVLGFTPDGDMWAFPDWNSLTSVGRLTLKNNKQDGMELISADGRRWRVKSIRRVGRAGPLMKWFVMGLLAGFQSRIEHDLEEMEPVTLGEIHDRTCAHVEQFWEYYVEFEENRNAEVAERLNGIRKASNFSQILDVLGLDSFMAY